MKHVRCAVVFFCALLCLSSCVLVKQQASQPPEGAYKVYFATDGKVAATQSVDFEYCQLPEGVDVATALAEAVLSGPKEAESVSPLPAGVTVRSVDWDGDGQIHLNLSEQYGGLSGVDLTVANACFVLTLSQVPGVKNVYITVEGELSPFQSLKTLSEVDFLISGGEVVPVNTTVKLFFPRADGAGLGVEERALTVGASDTLTALVISALLVGPQSQELVAFAPSNSALRWTRVEDGICAVSLSESFYAGVSEDEVAARLALYSLVDTLCTLEGAQIERVELLMEGNAVSSYGGISFNSPLSPVYDLEKMENQP